MFHALGCISDLISFIILGLFFLSGTISKNCSTLLQKDEINWGQEMKNLSIYINSAGCLIALQNKKKSKHVFDQIKEVMVDGGSVSFLAKKILFINLLNEEFLFS